MKRADGSDHEEHEGRKGHESSSWLEIKVVTFVRFVDFVAAAVGPSQALVLPPHLARDARNQLQLLPLHVR